MNGIFRFAFGVIKSNIIIIPENYRKSQCVVKDLKSQNNKNVKIKDGVFKIAPGEYEIVAKKKL